jgi:putative chitinase
MSFEFNFNAAHVHQILCGNQHAQEWYDALCDELPKYEITSINRVAAFMAQTAHESGNYTMLKENLNYSPKGLMATWKSRFPADIAEAYAHNPEKIANRAYCDRMGNGSEESGDGWLFHGRGLIQLTGRSLYEAFAREISKGLEETVSYCETPDGAVESACFFWEHHKCNNYADSQDMRGLTKVINGGYLGLDDRIARYNHALTILSA